jgi:retron-type reverse transcriptase
MEDGELVTTETGTPQGAVASPLLANIYLHYVFDLWADRWRKRHARGKIIIVRYADDIVMGFEHESPVFRNRAGKLNSLISVADLGWHVLFQRSP